MTEAPGPRRWPLWVVLGVVGALLSCGVPTAVIVALREQGPGAAASASPVAIHSPEPGDPEQVTQLWLRERIAEVLTQQAGALLRGDERGFLAVAEPKSAAVAALRRQFRSLRALKVTAWQVRITDIPDRVGSQWRVTVTYEHCFVDPGCLTGPVSIETTWADRAGVPRMVALAPSPSGQDGPRPWEASDLVVAVGQRAVVATTAKQKGRLTEVLREAERAAEVADRYAVDGTPPRHYQIFYAGEAEWRRWYGGDRPEWTAGYAVPVGGGRFDVVLNGKDLHVSVLDDLLRHEMTHAASLPGGGYRTGDNWWLVEGVADLAAAGGRPVGRYESLPDVRRLVSSGWNGPLSAAEPGARATDWQVSAAYGIGYLAVRHLVDRFGEQAMLAFFKAVVHERKSPDEASPLVFGEPWQSLQDDCVSYVRTAAS
ncbi:hypothetical protein RB614_19545 [Phytohabitans sp. ZYX-F-186]|uniref:Peptidase MA-like domain-containing protein n=1 Tax=Phytohabitans maris TaxID=3071409 RepID=A0ABU0ZJZ9_9ACTN|nr:hypothetical protein [Phytohabitans sp. ZYX-F-186]MDQ7906714.1 hypothetical protein [Phytohabitans sp. ZYX-F-186]